MNSSSSQPAPLSPNCNYFYPLHPITVPITQLHRQQKNRVYASMSDPTTIDTTTTADDSNSGVDLSPIVPTKDRKNSLEHGTSSSIPTAAQSLANKTGRLNSPSIPPRRERPRGPQHLASWGTGDSASSGWYLHPPSSCYSPAIIDLVLAELEKAMAQDALKKHLAKRPTKEELLQSELAPSFIPRT